MILNGLMDADATVDAPYYEDCHHEVGAMGTSSDLSTTNLHDGLDEYDALQLELLTLFLSRAGRSGGMGVSRSFLDSFMRSPSSFPLQNAVVAMVRSVSRYLSKDAIRECSLRRVADAITEDTRVVVAHSLGSVVAYEALLGNRIERQPVFVTLGSPLGLSPIRSSLQGRFASVGDRLPAPPVASWLNVSVADDWVPAVPILSEYYHGVQDVSLPGSGLFANSSLTAHSRSSYLAIDEVVKKVRGALAE
ncbi:hypothetical protein [Plantibacter sp. LMC-P-059a]|uniref:hypothetical protein n=1 Tax=Plantibacter sp. LMC-P-059a TaxID=3040297 RepID=UPI00254F5064|nr:hypothetical protein [Plantibacter sp. LMC-P-059a]